MRNSETLICDYLHRQAAQNSEFENKYISKFATRDLAGVGTMLSRTLAELDFNPEAVLFSAISEGAVFGFQDSEQDKVVIKVFPKRFSRSEMDTIVHVQKVLRESSFPLPKVMGPLQHLQTGRFALATEFVEGEDRSGHITWVRQTMARHLAEFSNIVDRAQLQPMASASTPVGRKLWPNVDFDFSRTTRGAATMRNRARPASAAIRAANLPGRLAHNDWGVKNARFRDDTLVAVFDWDSLSTMSEAEMVGRAAAQFTAHWGIETRVAPTSEEALAFLEEYQDARKRRFNTLELTVASAAADYIVALIARYEYNGKPHGDNSYGQLLRDMESKPLLGFPYR